MQEYNSGNVAIRVGTIKYAFSVSANLGLDRHLPFATAPCASLILGPTISSIIKDVTYGVAYGITKYW
jgi:hypothetical protein